MRAAAIALLLVPPPADPPWIDPFPDGQSIQVKPVENKDRVQVVNDTHLYLSASVAALDGEGETLLPYAAPDFASSAPNLVFPQSGIGTLNRSNDVELSQPRGRNARVFVLTPGVIDGEPTTPEEAAICDGLLARTVVDGVVINFLTSAVGHWMPDGEGKRKILKQAIVVAISQNRLFLEELRARLRAGEPAAFAGAVVNAVLRDIDASGPIGTAILTTAGLKMRDLLLKKFAEETLKKYIPFYNIPNILKNLVNWGPTAVDILQVAYDLAATPSKLSFAVYFRPGAGSIEPTSVRTNREPKTFTIRGHRMNDRRRWPLVHFHDRAGRRFWSGEPWEVADSGYEMKVLLPAAALESMQGHITCRVSFGADEQRLPERIQLVNTLQITRVEPPQGHPGQLVEIFGEDLYPFTICNRVRFEREDSAGRKEVRPLTAGRRSLRVAIPDLGEGRWKVSVVERYSDRVLESNALPFTRLPGTLAEAEAARREEAQPESEQVLEGVVGPRSPDGVHALVVPAGMEVEAELEALDAQGPFSIDHWGLAISDGRERSWTGLHRGPLSLRQPAQRLRHATHGDHGAHGYLVALRYGAGGEIRYRIRVKLSRRDDLGSGLDAPGGRQSLGLLLQPGEPRSAYLSGGDEAKHGDREDWYRIPDVPEYQRVTVTISDLVGRPPGEARLEQVKLYREREGRTEELAASARNLSSRDLPAVLSDVEGEPRSYRLQVKHGAGSAAYRIALAIENVPGPALDRTPVRSSFNQGTDEGWVVEGNFRPGSVLPEYRSSGMGDGWIACADPAAAVGGALDVVFAVDTTGSMGAAIASVRDSTRAIIEELRRRSPSLRVGLVNFKDSAADGAGARVLTPLSDKVEECLRTVGTWQAAGGGSDVPEDALFALEGALEMGWRTRDDRGAEVARAIVLVTDAGFKVGADGKDFGGRSIDAIAQLARRKGVRIYPMPIGNDAGLRAQAGDLAVRSEGRLIAAARPQDVAAGILSLVEFAVDRSSPRMFSAPHKFLGDLSRFYGATLDFRIRGKGEGRRFDAADVVLQGKEQTLQLKTLLPEGGEPSLGIKPFTRCSVRLDADSRWILRGSGARATRDDLLAVLGDLKALLIRAEFRAGPDEVELDEVLLGGNGPVTDRGMTDLGMLDSISDRLRGGTLARARFVEKYQRPDDDLIERLKAARIPDPTMRGWADASKISGPLRGPGEAVYDVELDRLRRVIDRIRARGLTSKEDSDALQAGAKDWDGRRKQLGDLAEELMGQVVAEAVADRAFNADPLNARPHTEARRRAREAQERIARDLDALSDRPSWPLLR